MIYRIEEIRALREKAIALRLDGCSRLARYSDEELAQVCNGIGSDAMPEFVVDIVTKFNPTLETAAFIHDVEFYESTGCKSDFFTANRRLAENGAAAAKASYGWYNPLRYIVIRQAQRFARLCDLFGFGGYYECYIARKYGEEVAAHE